MKRSLLLSLAAALLAAAAGACSSGDSGTETRADTSQTTTRTQHAGCAEAVAGRGAGRDPARLAGIAREVERMRGLEFRRLPAPTYLRQAELSRRLRAEVAREIDRSEIEGSRHALVALGAIPKGLDLLELLTRRVATETAGYYDPRTRELVVLSDTQRRLNDFERLTLAHELLHALTDQALGLPGDPDQETPDLEEDREFAELAVIEGDAMLMTKAFARMIVPGLAETLSAGWITGSAPYYIEASEAFPYLEGERFVCALFRNGGWAAVDRAYRRPPTTTAQILFPERYLAGEGEVDAPPPASPGPGWTRIDHTSVGASDLLFLFEAPENVRSRALAGARQRAAAWAGGEAAVWKRGRRALLGFTLVERPGAAPRLCDSMRAWAEAARRPAGAIRCSGRVVRVNLPA